MKINILYFIFSFVPPALVYKFLLRPETYPERVYSIILCGVILIMELYFIGKNIGEVK